MAVIGISCRPSGVAEEADPGASAFPRATVRIAYVADLSVDDGPAHLAAAFQGITLAVADADEDGAPARAEVVEYDTEGDAARAAEVTGELAADADVVAVVVGPFTAMSEGGAASLARAGIPVLSLSTLGAPRGITGGSGWYRVVAPIREQARTIASHVRGMRAFESGLCLVGDGSSTSRALLRDVEEEARASRAVHISVPAGSDPTPAHVAAIVRAGCVPVWGGFTNAAAALAEALAAEGIHLVGADAMKSEAFLLDAGEAATGTVVSCACVDLTTDTALPAQRFVNRFQFEFGSPPDAYAAEGYDVGTVLASAIENGGPTRARVADALRAAEPFEGLATVYRFDSDGELAAVAQTVSLTRAEAGRWVALEPEDA